MGNEWFSINAMNVFTRESISHQEILGFNIFLDKIYKRLYNYGGR
ncbi:MAG: hypothetical protein JWM44_2614 [Bacilli bacterium]|nr:hypothetical protein [Bacilli bacterium]